MKQTDNYYKTLWDRFRADDKAALALIYDDFVGVLYNYGYHICQDPFVVQDAIQDLFVDLWRLRATLSEAQSVKFYLFRSLRRRLHRAIDAQKNTSSFEDNYGLTVTLQDADPFDEEDYARKIKQLQKLVTTLPPRQEEALRLRFFEDFSLEQVADMMSMNEQSVRNTINRAVKKLRESFVYWSWVLIFYINSEITCG
jgi:RNA polymerase sigma factor (sigma-70 family)